MYRKAKQELLLWKEREGRKPLIIRGARQVGKTWLVRSLAEHFSCFIEINFDKNPEKADLFSAGNIDRTLELIEIDSGASLVVGNTLLFLDEIQSAPDVLPVLRYFYEERPDIHVIAAGSLLEFLLAEHDFSMPVGRIEYLYLGPMDFEEFVAALGQPKLVDYLANYTLPEVIPLSIHEKLLELLKLYWIIGGMPAAVAAWIRQKKPADVTREHASILQTSEADFAKYRRKIYPQRLRGVFAKIPALIGRKLKYVNLDPDEKAKNLADTLDLLEMARIIYLVRHSAGNGLPLGAEVKEKVFKPLFLDVGLVSTSLGLSLAHVEQIEELLLVHNGAVAEQFIGQHLLYQSSWYGKPQLYYWNREQKSSNAEVDYLVSVGPAVIPVEVKAGKSGSLKSLQVFVTEKKSPLDLRFDANPPSISQQQTAIAGMERTDYPLVSLPLYLVCQAKRMVQTLLTEL